MKKTNKKNIDNIIDKKKNNNNNNKFFYLILFFIMKMNRFTIIIIPIYRFRFFIPDT